MRKCISCHRLIMFFAVTWKNSVSLIHQHFIFIGKKLIEMGSNFFDSNTLNTCETDKEKKCMYTGGMCICEGRENNLLLVFLPTAQSSSSDAHRTEIYEGTTSVRVGNSSRKHVYYISFQWHEITVRLGRYRQISSESIFKLRIRLWSDFGRALSCSDVWLSAPCVFQHSTESLTSDTKS